MNITKGFHTFTDAFSKSVSLYSSNIAVYDEFGHFTYASLNAISDSLARKIISLKANRGNRVLAYLPREKEIVATALGIWKAGCVYVPIDYTYPYERINYMIKDATPVSVCTTRELWKKKPLNIAKDKVIFVDEIDESIVNKVKLTKIVPDDDAIIIYTSSSTGKPKGVLHTHRSLFALINYQPDTEPKISAKSKYANMTSFSFIASITDIYSPLLCGGSTFIVSDVTRQDPKRLYDLLIKEKITNIHAPVRLAVILLENYDMSPFYVRMGGEKVSPFKPLYPTTITEQYGGSEGCFPIYGRITGKENPMPLGKVNKGITYKIIDEDGQEVKLGETGEFIYAGEIQAKQYLNLPKLTKEKWVIKNNKRWFYTGDLMREDKDGNLYFVQRKDFMVKVNGFRIELGEIENIVMQYPGVKETVCVVKNINGADHLCCFYAGPKVNEDDANKIKKRLLKYLPSYMVPSFVIYLNKLPRNHNGKINRQAMPEINVAKFKRKTYVAPRNELEKKIYAAFKKTLGIKDKVIGIDDNFFEIGGNSILVMKLLTNLNIPNITSMDIFKAKSVRAIASLSSKKHKQPIFDFDANEKESEKNEYPLTSFQSKILKDQLIDLHSTVWNIPALFLLKKDINADKLCDAINHVLIKHPSLLTIIKKDKNGKYYQSYAPKKFVPVHVTRFSESLFLKKKDHLVLPFKVFNELLYTVKVIKTEKNVYLYTDFHHLRVDGTSLGIIYKEIADAYQGIKNEDKDYYYNFLEEEKQSKALLYLKDKRYFIDRYGKISKWARVPKYDFDKHKRRIYSPGIYSCGLALSDIKKAEKRYNASRNVFAVAAGIIALMKHTNKKDVMVSWIYDNRSNLAYAHTVGSINKELPVGISFDSVKNSNMLIDEIKKQVINGLSYSQYEYITEQYIPFKTDTIFINYVGRLRNHSNLKPLGAKQIALNRPHDTSKVSLGLAVFENENDDVVYGIEYCNDLYNKKTATRYMQLFKKAFVNLIKGKN